MTAADLSDEASALTLPFRWREDHRVDLLAEHRARIAAPVVNLVHVRCADDRHINVAGCRAPLTFVAPGPGAEQVGLLDGSDAVEVFCEYGAGTERLEQESR